MMPFKGLLLTFVHLVYFFQLAILLQGILIDIYLDSKVFLFFIVTILWYQSLI